MAKQPQQTNVFTDIDFNFELNPVTKDLKTVTDVNAIKQSLKALLLNKKLWNFDNINLTQLQFENLDYIFQNTVILSQLEEKLQIYEPRATSIRIEASKQFNGQVLQLDVFFAVKNVPGSAENVRVFKRIS